MTAAVLLAAVALGTVPAAHVLAGARWPWRAPRLGIALWQALGLAWGIATIGALVGFGVAPYGGGVVRGLLRFAVRPEGLDALHLAALAAGVSLAGILQVMLFVALARVVRTRRRHRALLALVAHGAPGVPGTLVVDHPVAAAYCVPGVRSQVVVSAGTLQLLDRFELAAVLAHERAHARERHDLVLLPFTSLRLIFPWLRIVARSLDAVELLIEMTADDRARRHRPARELATALLRFAAARPAPSPAGTLGAADSAVLARVRRLMEPVPLSRGTRATMVVTAALLTTLPPLLYAFPS